MTEDEVIAMMRDPRQHQHVMFVRGSEMKMRHPLEERLGFALDACPVHDAVLRGGEDMSVFMEGTYLVEWDPRRLSIERIGDLP